MKDHLEVEKGSYSPVVAMDPLPSLQPFLQDRVPIGYSALTSSCVYALSDVAFAFSRVTHISKAPSMEYILYNEIFACCFFFLGCSPARVPPATTLH